MKRISCLLSVVLFSFIWNGKTFSGSQADESSQTFIIKVTENSDQLLQTLHQRPGATVISDFKIFKNLHVLQFDSPIDAKEIISIYESHPDVVYIERNMIYYANDILGNFIQNFQDGFRVIPDDPRFSDLWGMSNSGQAGGTIGADIGASNAWDIATGSRDVVVAVIDTGIDYTHEDIKENIWKNSGETGPDNQGESKETNGIDDDGNGFIDDVYGWDFSSNDNDPMDDHSHGTHCAGTIGASGNNGTGVVGVNWQVRLMALKFLSASGSGTAEGAIKSIEYAILSGANILSNSWGGGEYSRALEEAIEYAMGKDILFVAAAGNSGSDNDQSLHYPSSYTTENIFAVAATNSVDTLPSFSCYGRESVDIGAPGEGILSTILDNKYEKMSGTSMATPHVAGAAALLLSYEPELSSLELKDRLMKSSDKIYALKKKVASNGRLNILNALLGVEPPPPWPEIDPSLWENFTHEISSPHPYPDNYDETFIIEHPGADYIRVHFSKIEVETRYDFVEIYSGEGNLIETLNGSYSDYWSDAVPGGVVKIRLVSDRSVSKYGFDVDAYGAAFMEQSSKN